MRPRPSLGPRLATAMLLACAGFAVETPLSAQDGVRVQGRVTDQATDAPVTDATVTMAGRSTATDQGGFFLIDSVPPGVYDVRVRHLAYGEFSEEVRVDQEPLRLRVRMSETALELEPVIVELESRDQRDARVRGTRRNVVNRSQIERALGTSANLGTVLTRNIPGVRLRSGSGRTGGSMCIEFRSGRSLDNPLACHHPMVFMDGVRVANPGILYGVLNLDNVHRLEVVPPGEAGVRYGTDSQYGVLLIETRSGANARQTDPREEVRTLERRGGTYDWTEEPEPYPWAKVFGSAFLANAAGLALGVATARNCLSFDGLSKHFLESGCGSWGTRGARVALIAVPVGAVTLGAHATGGSDLSKGRLLQTAVGALVIGVPGYIIATGGEADAFAGADWVGGAMLLVGVPLVTTVADRLFRKLRD